MRTSTVAATVPTLCNYDNLRCQFQWLVDGDLESLIEENLEKEIDLLEEYLLDLGKKDISDMIFNGTKLGEDYYHDSGKVFKWVSVLRAADSLWSSTDQLGFIRLAEEGVTDSSPQIIATCWDR